MAIVADSFETKVVGWSTTIDWISFLAFSLLALRRVQLSECELCGILRDVFRLAGIDNG